MAVEAPGPLLQKCNAALHKDPLKIIAFGVVWSFQFLFVAPFAVLFLQCQMLLRLFRWWFQTDGKETYSPKNQTETELAVFITGCDSGFGKELALWAAQAGYTVFAACLKGESMTQFQSDASIIPLQVDVCSDSDVDAAVERVRSWLTTPDENDTAKLQQQQDDPPSEMTGRQGQSLSSRRRVLHAVVNNAGIGIGGEIDWMTMKEFEILMNVNYFGLIRCCKAFLPLLKEQSLSGLHTGARIVNLTSMAGMLPAGTGLAAYGAAKHAATVLSNSLRIELAHFGIQVVTVCPGFHGTSMVHTMKDMIEKTWQALPPAKREEYGEDFFQRHVRLGVELPQSWAWNQAVVVEELFQCLTCRSVPGTVIVGSDMQYGGIWLRWLPWWCVDLLWIHFWNRPVPAAVIKARQKQ